MKKLLNVSQNSVWRHWKAVEGFSKDSFRSDIRSPLPGDLRWCLAEIEAEDVEQMFIISSRDWVDISRKSFRLEVVSENLQTLSNNNDTVRIKSDIEKKIDFVSSGGELDTKLIAVTHSDDLSGPFTFIEGNRRSVALLALNRLVGCRIFLGISPEIKLYKWSKMSYLNQTNPTRN